MLIWPWAGFLALIALMLWIDLRLINRGARPVTARRALAWAGACIAMALAFAAFIHTGYERGLLGINASLVLGPAGHFLAGPPEPGAVGGAAALQFLVACIVEYSLSLDNIFVIAMIFAYFRVRPEHQHPVLIWSILGAVLLRGILIISGMGLINLFEWLTYPLGAILLFSAVKMLVVRTDDIDFDANIVVRMARKTMPIAGDDASRKFFVRLPPGAGRAWAMTPLMLVLLVVTVIDTIFALDSIPAVFAITRDPFIALTSNIFAVLGLRSLYFALAAVIDKFKFLKVSLVFILAYLGVKVIIQPFYPIETMFTLAMITSAMAVGILASILGDRRGRRAREAPLGPEVERVARLTLRQMRRAVVLVVGITVVLVGLIMLGPIPGPGILIVPVGLGILAAEFVWARHLLALFRDKAARFERQAEAALMKRPRPWLIPLVFGATVSIVTALTAFQVLSHWAGAAMGAGLFLGQVFWANGLLTRYRAYILGNPEAARDDARPPLWIVPIVLLATAGALVLLIRHPDLPNDRIALCFVGILFGEACWAAMWIQAWLRALPPRGLLPPGDHPPGPGRSGTRPQDAP